jgi:hypothetical protein
VQIFFQTMHIGRVASSGDIIGHQHNQPTQPTNDCTYHAMNPVAELMAHRAARLLPRLLAMGCTCETGWSEQVDDLLKNGFGTDSTTRAGPVRAPTPRSGSDR